MRKGELPTVREVGSLVGLRSPATVLKHLRSLEKAGVISMNGKSRGIRIEDPNLIEEIREGDATEESGRAGGEHDPDSVAPGPEPL